MSTFGTRVLTEPVSQWLNFQPTVFGFPGVVQRSATVTVTADVTTHTKGAWTELIASTTDDSDFLMLFVVNSQSGAATQGLIDIGVGSAGNETVIVANAVGGQINNQAAIQKVDQYFSVFIPKGSRVSARVQNVVSSRTASVNITLGFNGASVASYLDTYGADTSTSVGVTLTNSNTYYEVTSSTSAPYKGIVMVPQGSSANTPAATLVYTLGVGVSGSEIDLRSLTSQVSSAEFQSLNWTEQPFIYWGFFPAGSRLAVKSSLGAISRHVILFGIPF
jgi:hypothetical protein